jgi:selenocysteine lyase/cysteine desulfurase
MRMLEHGFFIAAGLAPYNAKDEVEKFVQTLDGIVRET